MPFKSSMGPGGKEYGNTVRISYSIFRCYMSFFIAQNCILTLKLLVHSYLYCTGNMYLKKKDHRPNKKNSINTATYMVPYCNTVGYCISYRA